MEIVYFWMTVSPAILLLCLVLIGDFDIEFDIDVGEFHIGESYGIGPVSFKLILAFISGYGLGGYLDYQFNWPLFHAITGLLFGILVYLIVYITLKILYSQRSNTQVIGTNVIGTNARVTTGMVGSSIGEILATDPLTQTSLYMLAMSKDSVDIKKGELVYVDDIEGSLAIVHQLNDREESLN